MESYFSYENYLDSIINNFPQGRIKIIRSLMALLETKESIDITIADISKHAGVSETLIYKYYKNKKELLFLTLYRYTEYFFENLDLILSNETSAIERIRKLIEIYVTTYNREMIFARLILIEVRYTSDYYGSDLFKLFLKAIQNVTDIVKTGIEEGEIESNVSPVFTGQFIIGSIEHSCRNAIINRQKLSAQEITHNLSTLLFEGIRTKKRD